VIADLVVPGYTGIALLYPANRFINPLFPPEPLLADALSLSLSKSWISHFSKLSLMARSSFITKT
jgi:hypothetical protein